MAALTAVDGSNISFRPPTERQKKYRCEMSSSRRERSRNRSIALGQPHSPGRTGRAPGHAFGTRVEVERRAVVEERTPLRVERNQIELVGQIAAGLGEDSLEHRRHQEDRRPHVEPVAFDLEHGRLAAQPSFFSNSTTSYTRCGQRASGGQAAETPADHADPASTAFFHRVPVISLTDRCSSAFESLASLDPESSDQSHLDQVGRQDARFDGWNCGSESRRRSRTSPSTGTAIPRSSPISLRRDPGRFEDHGQPAAGMRPAADQIDRLQILKSIPGTEVEHLRQAVGQIEGRAQVDLVIASQSAGVTIRSNRMPRGRRRPSRSSPVVAMPARETAGLSRPVDVGMLVGDRDQDVERATPSGSQAGSVTQAFWT